MIIPAKAAASPSANLLALDTATELCSVALRVGGRLSERIEPAGNRHSAMLLPMIDSLLVAEGITLAAVQAIAFGAGPGSFTGLRIACSVAQGLAWARDLPLLPIGNLAALAHAAFDGAGDIEGTLLVAIDARMEEAYWAVYARQRGALVELQAPALARRTDLPALARHHAVQLAAGDAWSPELAAAVDGLHRVDARASARALLQLADVDYAAGAAVTPAEAAPLYVRDRVALTVAERRAAARQP